MNSVSFFDSIRIDIPRRKIYSRLGYRKGKTILDAARRRDIERALDEAEALIRLRGCGVRLAVRGRTGSGVVLGAGDIVIESRDIMRLLERSAEVLLMGATAGPDIIESIRRDTDRGDLSHGIVLDAAAGEMTDAALDWIVRYYGHELSRENRRLTRRRFSAGYGDFDLENQVWIHRVLKLDRLDVAITPGFMLVPEKSVTALAGIEGI